MSKRWLKSDSITIRRAVIWTAGLFPVVLVGLIFAFWLASAVPTWVFWRVALVLLVALEVVYGASVAVAAACALLLGALALRRGRRAWTAPWLTRGLVVCGAILVAAMVAEAAGAAWRIGAQRSSATSAGAPRREPAAAGDLRFRAPIADFSLPTEFEDPPGDRDIDIVVIGESSAAAVPYDRWFSIGTMLGWKLSEGIPGLTVRPRILAISGSTLEWQHKLLADLRRRPEIFVIYCGQDEIVMRIPTWPETAHYYDELLPGAGDILVEWVERSSPLCGLLHESQEECRLGVRRLEQSDRQLVDTRAYTITEYTTLLRDFRRRLEKIVSYAEQIGALPVLVAPASNDARFEPNRSFLPADTPRREREAFAREFLKARRMENTDRDRAIACYRALVARQPGFAESYYRLGRLLEGKGEWDEAYRHYIAARDLDGFPTRTLTAFQNVYREVAARHDCIFIDMQSYFHLIGRHGLLDDELFQDAMHLSLRGHIALAQAVLQALRARRAFGWPKDSAEPSIDPSACVLRCGLKPADWRALCFWGIMFGDIAVKWRYDPSRRLRMRLRYSEAADRIEAGAAPDSLDLPNIGVPAPIPVELSAQAGAPLAPKSRSSPPDHFDAAPPR
jgi:hypothetical protein